MFPAQLATAATLLSGLLLAASPSRAAVSPPRWADPARNPCAAQPGGWQLLQWPSDGRCYRIFTVGAPGPCPPTQELAPDARSGAATCRCPPGRARLVHPRGEGDSEDDKCYELFKRQPCPQGQYFAPLPAGQEDERRLGACVPLGRCEVEGDVFWPATRRCYPALTRGPCPRGELLVAGRSAPSRRRRPHDQENDTDPAAQIAAASSASAEREDDRDGGGEDLDDEDGLPRCGCSSEGALASHFWAAGDSSSSSGGGGACYEHFTRGPCLEDGHLFLPGGTCGCHIALPHYHNATGRCYQLGTAGPCPAGHEFVAAPGEAHARCRCKAGHVPWTGDGGAAAANDDDDACHRLYTRGPCPDGQFLLDMATCATLCQRGRLYFPEHNICYRVGLRGPCPRGQIVLFEDSVRPSVDGISYRGMCGCSNGARDCAPAATAYRDAVVTTSATAAAFCDAKAGLVRWNGTCQALYTRGPCAENQWLVPEREGRLLWDESGWRKKQTNARCDCRPGYKGIKTDGILQCQPPAVSLAKFLNQKYHPNRSGGSDEWW